MCYSTPNTNSCCAPGLKPRMSSEHDDRFSSGLGNNGCENEPLLSIFFSQPQCREHRRPLARAAWVRNTSIWTAVLRPKMHNTTGYKQTCAVEQAVHVAKCALPSTAGSLELGSLHTQGALFRESMSHQSRVLIGY